MRSSNLVLYLLPFHLYMERIVVRCLHALGPPMLQVILWQRYLLVLLIVSVLVQILIACPLSHWIQLLLLLLSQLLITTLLVDYTWLLYYTIWVLSRRREVVLWIRLLLSIYRSWVSTANYILKHLYAIHILLPNDAQYQSLVFIQELDRIVWCLQYFEYLIKLIFSNLLLKEVCEKDRSVWWNWQFRVEEHILWE
jgi:hypothetical protein